MFDKVRKLIEDGSCDEGLKQLELMIPLSVGSKDSMYARQLENSMADLLEGIYYCGYSDGHKKGKKEARNADLTDIVYKTYQE